MADHGASARTASRACAQGRKPWLTIPRGGQGPASCLTGRDPHRPDHPTRHSHGRAPRLPCRRPLPLHHHRDRAHSGGRPRPGHRGGGRRPRPPPAGRSCPPDRTRPVGRRGGARPSCPGSRAAVWHRVPPAPSPPPHHPHRRAPAAEGTPRPGLVPPRPGSRESVVPRPAPRPCPDQWAQSCRSVRRFAAGVARRAVGPGRRSCRRSGSAAAGRAVRTAFVCDFLKDGDLVCSEKEAQGVSMLALHLFRFASVHVSTLLVSRSSPIRSGPTPSLTRTGAHCLRCSGRTWIPAAGSGWT